MHDHKIIVAVISMQRQFIVNMDKFDLYHFILIWKNEN